MPGPGIEPELQLQQHLIMESTAPGWGSNPRLHCDPSHDSQILNPLRPGGNSPLTLFYAKVSKTFSSVEYCFKTHLFFLFCFVFFSFCSTQLHEGFLALSGDLRSERWLKASVQ